MAPPPAVSSGDPAAASAIPVAASKPAEIFWEGGSGEWHVRWSSGGLDAFRGADREGPVFSLARQIAQRVAREKASERADQEVLNEARRRKGESPAAASTCSSEVSARLLSVVGSLLSYEEASATTCAGAAHPSEEARYVTIDLGATPPGVVTLAALFPEPALAAALRADTTVRRALDAPLPPRLADLTGALAAAPPVLDATACYAFPDDLLTRFAFHHLEGARVAVRLALAGAGPCRARLTEIGLLLPASAALAPLLQSARTGSGGLLAARAEKLARGRRTVISVP